MTRKTGLWRKARNVRTLSLSNMEDGTMANAVEELTARLDTIERRFAERIDRLDAVLTELRQAADGGFGRLERRMIQLVQVLVAARHVPGGHH
jgi:hypothetical protein